MSPLFELLWDAIVKKRQIVTRYKGCPRVLCPHVLGYKNGKEHCLFYQCGGTSNSGLGPVGSSQNWRCIPLDGLDEVSARDGSWYTAYNSRTRPQTCVEQVVIEVSDEDQG
jgi:hypothetical protein